jgi:hypothetical protein
MKKWIWLGAGVLAVGFGVAACATSRTGYATAPYKLSSADGAFEIREYPEISIVATDRGRDGDSFMRLFRYIDGGNETKEKISMTTPVFMVDGKMAFVMPEKHQSSPPSPTSAQVKLDRMKSQRVAVYRYSGARSEESEPAALKVLRAWMAENQWEEAGKPFAAYYDPPWTPGFLRRNEVLIPVKPGA